jgi:hypothetical protein
VERAAAALSAGEACGQVALQLGGPEAATAAATICGALELYYPTVGARARALVAKIARYL